MRIRCKDKNNKVRVMEILNAYIDNEGLKTDPYTRILVFEPAKEFIDETGTRIMLKSRVESPVKFVLSEKNLPEGISLEYIMKNLVEKGYYDFEAWSYITYEG